MQEETPVAVAEASCPSSCSEDASTTTHAPPAKKDSLGDDVLMTNDEHMTQEGRAEEEAKEAEGESEKEEAKEAEGVNQETTTEPKEEEEPEEEEEEGDEDKQKEESLPEASTVSSQSPPSLLPSTWKLSPRSQRSHTENLLALSRSNSTTTKEAADKVAQAEENITEEDIRSFLSLCSSRGKQMEEGEGEAGEEKEEKEEEEKEEKEKEKDQETEKEEKKEEERKKEETEKDTGKEKEEEEQEEEQEGKKEKKEEEEKKEEKEKKAKDEKEKEEGGEAKKEEQEGRLARNRRTEVLAGKRATQMEGLLRRFGLAIYKAAAERRKKEAEEGGGEIEPLLLVVVREAEPQILSKLLQCEDIDVNEQDKVGRTALYVAVQTRQEDSVALLLAHPGVLVDKGDVTGVTPLSLASYTGQTQVVKSLLESGADVNKANMIGATALHAAVEQGHLETASLLLEAGADVNKADDSGFTALSIALLADSLELVTLLVKSGASVLSTDQYGRRPADLAKSTATRELLMHCADYQRHKQLRQMELSSNKNISSTPLQLVTSDSEPYQVDFLPAFKSLIGLSLHDDSSSPASPSSTISSPSSSPSSTFVSSTSPAAPSSLLKNNKAKVGISCCPGRNKKRHQRDLYKDMKRLKEEFGCDVLVTLVQQKELDAMGITNFFRVVENHGIKSIWVPITDKWLPREMEMLIRLVRLLMEEVKQEKCIVVHCNGGKGRSAMVVVSLLVALGMNVNDAINLTRAARPGNTLRNPAQIAYVNLFKKYWLKRRSRTTTTTATKEGNQQQQQEAEKEQPQRRHRQPLSSSSFSSWRKKKTLTNSTRGTQQH